MAHPSTKDWVKCCENARPFLFSLWLFGMCERKSVATASWMCFFSILLFGYGNSESNARASLMFIDALLHCL